MRLFNVVPFDHSAKPVEVIAFDEASVLHVADRLGGSAADVFEEGRYRFSIRKNPEAGFWTIFRKPGRQSERSAA